MDAPDLSKTLEVSANDPTLDCVLIFLPFKDQIPQ